MVDFNAIRQYVQNSMGRKYGDFDSSVKSLSKKYENRQESDNVTNYYDNGKLVAKSHKQKGLNCIHDMLGNATYLAGNDNNTKFTSIWQNTPAGRVKFYDANHNGIIDENDIVELGGPLKMTVSTLLDPYTVIDVLTGK